MNEAKPVPEGREKLCSRCGQTLPQYFTRHTDAGFCTCTPLCPECGEATSYTARPGHPDWSCRCGWQSPVEDADHHAFVAAGETLERVRGLVKKWNNQQTMYPGTAEGEHSAAAVRCCIRELLEILEAKP